MESKSFRSSFAEEDKLFDSLQRNFQAILNELLNDSTLDKFRDEYEKLYKELKKSHESNKSLIAKCAELNKEIIDNSKKVQAALVAGTNDQTSIIKLRKEFDSAWKVIEDYNERDEKNKQITEVLKQQLLELQQKSKELQKEKEENEEKDAKHNEEVNKIQLQIIKILKTTSVNNSAEIQRKITLYKEKTNELKKKTSEYNKDYNNLSSEVAKIRENVEEMKAENENLTKQVLSGIEKKKEMEVAIENKMTEVNNERIKKNSIQKEKDEIDTTQLNIFKASTMNKQRSIAEKKKQLSIEQKKTAATQSMLKDKELHVSTIKTSFEETREIENLRKEEIKLQKSFEEAKLKRKEVQGNIEAAKEKLKDLERQKTQIIAKRDNLNLKNMSDKIEASKEENEKSKSEKENELKKLQQKDEKEKQNAAYEDIDLVKAEKLDGGAYIQFLSDEIEKLTYETQETKLQTEKELKKIRKNEAVIKENERAMLRAKELTVVYASKAKEERVDFNNLLRKDHLLSKERNDFAEEIKYFERNIEEMKNEVKQRDDECIDFCIHLKETEEVVANQEKQVEDIKKKIEETNQKLEESRLNLIDKAFLLEVANVETSNIKSHIESMMKEREKLNNEIYNMKVKADKMKEEIKTITSVCNMSATKYQEKVDQIESMKESLNKQVQKVIYLGEKGKTADRARRELKHLERALFQEQQKAQVLEKEVENPEQIDVHEIMAFADPNLYAMIRMSKALREKVHEVTVEERKLRFSRIENEEKLKKLTAKERSRLTHEQVNKEVNDLTVELKQKQAALNRIVTETRAKKRKSDSAMGHLNDKKEELQKTLNEYNEKRSKEVTFVPRPPKEPSTGKSSRAPFVKFGTPMMSKPLYSARIVPPIIRKSITNDSCLRSARF